MGISVSGNGLRVTTRSTYWPIAALTFLCHPVVVDPEVNGGLDFYPHYLEILQAFSLMQERSLSPRPLGPDAEELLDLMGSIGPAASIRGLQGQCRPS